MAQPRKYRNAEERASIRAEVLPKLEEIEAALLGAGSTPEEQQGMQAVRTAVDRFVEHADRGGAETGALTMPTLGGARLEFHLPGRRVERPFVRVVPASRAPA